MKDHQQLRTLCASSRCRVTRYRRASGSQPPPSNRAGDWASKLESFSSPKLFLSPESLNAKSIAESILSLSACLKKSQAFLHEDGRSNKKLSYIRAIKIANVTSSSSCNKILLRGQLCPTRCYVLVFIWDFAATSRRQTGEPENIVVKVANRTPVRYKRAASERKTKGTERIEAQTKGADFE